MNKITITILAGVIASMPVLLGGCGNTFNGVPDENWLGQRMPESAELYETPLGLKRWKWPQALKRPLAKAAPPPHDWKRWPRREDIEWRRHAGAHRSTVRTNRFARSTG